MATILTLCNYITPAVLKPGDKFSIVRILNSSTCFKENYIVVHSESYSEYFKAKLEQRFIGDWEELPLGQCDYEMEFCKFDFIDWHVVQV